MHHIDFKPVRFWIQIHELPLEFLTVKSAEKILNQSFKVVEIEDPRVEGHIVRSFICARVELNVELPLPMGCWVQRRNMPRAWIWFKYERLQDLCFKCGVIGHEQKNCNKERVMSSLGQGVLKYGPRVGVAATKPIWLIMEELASSKKESTEQKTQSSSTTSGRGRSQAAQVRTIVLQEQLEQKNRIAEEEGVGRFRVIVLKERKKR